MERFLDGLQAGSLSCIGYVTRWLSSFTSPSRGQQNWDLSQPILGYGGSNINLEKRVKE
jgi:hypothetical protein